MTQWRHLHKKALQLIHWCGFWNGRPRQTLVLNRTQSFPVYLTFIGITGYEVLVLFPIGDAASNSWIRILKGRPWLYLVFNSNNTSTVHRFRCHKVLFSAGIDVTMLTPPGALQFVSLRIVRLSPDLIFVCNCNDTSIIHRVRFSQVLWSAGNDVLVFSPLGSAADEVWMYFWQKRPRIFSSV